MNIQKWEESYSLNYCDLTIDEHQRDTMQIVNYNCVNKLHSQSNLTVIYLKYVVYDTYVEHNKYIGYSGIEDTTAPVLHQNVKQTKRKIYPDFKIIIIYNATFMNMTYVHTSLLWNKD